MEPISPITRKQVLINIVSQPFTYIVYIHDQDGFANLYLAESFRLALPFNGTYKDYSPEDVSAAWSLIRSRLWLIKRNQLTPILITDENHQEHFESMLHSSFGDKLPIIPIPFEKFVKEARSLTLTDKALYTLDNVYSQYKISNQPLQLPHTILTGPTIIIKCDPKHIEDGQCYACDTTSAPFVYDYLKNHNYIEPLCLAGLAMGWVITSKGFEKIDERLKARHVNSKQVFFIRRYDQDLDRFLRPIADNVSKALNCSFEAVWEREHNDRIDERIFRLIRESAVVVVDVAADRYNVGLEHGYAMALGKPIVVIRQKPDPWIVPPFDISTQNCYDYDMSDPDALTQKLIARIGIAFDTMND